MGEASSSYLASSTAARGIAELQPGARLIAILREPASFLRSLHLQMLQNHIESERDLRRALALEPARRQGRQIPRRSPRPQALAYSERVRYLEQLRRYRAAFAEEQLLVLIYDDFRAANEATMGRVLRFLDVDPTVQVEPSEVNPTVRMRSQRLDQLVHTLTVGDSPLARVVRAPVKALAPRQVRHAALHGVRQRFVVGAPPPPDEELMLELRRRFAPEVVALSEYLDRDLVALWGYDRLDRQPCPAPGSSRGGSGCPTSSSSATPSAGRPRSTGCCGPTRRSSCPTSRSRGFSRRSCARPRAVPSSASGPRRSSEYLALFAPARPDQRAGEASSSYLMSPSAAGRIAELSPRARIVAILREPASFLRSLHLQNVQLHVETELDLRRALALEDERRRGRQIPTGCPRPQALLYSEHVRYVEQLRRYHERFGRAQVLVLIYDDFRARNEATVRRVLRFLEVDELAPIEVVEANPTVAVRSLHVHRAVQAVQVGSGPVAGAVRASLKSITSRRLRHAGLRAVRRGVVFGAPPPPDAELMAQLRRRFAPEVVALSEYLERDLVGLWGDDGVA